MIEPEPPAAAAVPAVEPGPWPRSGPWGSRLCLQMSTWRLSPRRPGARKCSSIFFFGIHTTVYHQKRQAQRPRPSAAVRRRCPQIFSYPWLVYFPPPLLLLLYLLLLFLHPRPARARGRYTASASILYRPLWGRAFALVPLRPPSDLLVLYLRLSKFFLHAENTG